MPLRERRKPRGVFPPSVLAVLGCAEFTDSITGPIGQSGVIFVRRSMVVGLFSLMLLGLATPAWAQDGQDDQDGQGGQAAEAFVVLSGPADVPEGRQVGDLVV